MNTTAKDYLESKGIKTTQHPTKLNLIKKEQLYDIFEILNGFADIKVRESKENPADTFTIELKNVDCDFNELRDNLDKICPSFTIDKDTFIFHAADMPTYVKLIKLRDMLKEKNKIILVNKEGF